MHLRAPSGAGGDAHPLPPPPVPHRAVQRGALPPPPSSIFPAPRAPATRDASCSPLRPPQISTARIAGLGLSSCDIVWDVQGAEVFPEPSALLAAGGVGLLYPGEGSVVLGPGASAPRALVVLDGTWSQARRILRKNEWLRALPQFALAPSPEERSNYRIRRQPAEHCLSTVECIARVLQAVEPDRPEAPELLLRAFDAMVDTQARHPPPGCPPRSPAISHSRFCFPPGARAQINCIEKNVAGTRRFHSKKAQRRSAAPEAGADAGVAPLSLPPQPRTCVVYSYLTGDAAAAAAAHWVALRTDTGEFFEARVRVQRGAEAAAQAAAPGEEGEEALGVEEFGREWDRFVLGCERIALWCAERGTRKQPSVGWCAGAEPHERSSEPLSRCSPAQERARPGEPRRARGAAAPGAPRGGLRRRGRSRAENEGGVRPVDRAALPREQRAQARRAPPPPLLLRLRGTPSRPALEGIPQRHSPRRPLPRQAR